MQEYPTVRGPYFLANCSRGWGSGFLGLFQGRACIVVFSILCCMRNIQLSFLSWSFHFEKMEMSFYSNCSKLFLFHFWLTIVVVNLVFFCVNSCLLKLWNCFLSVELFTCLIAISCSLIIPSNLGSLSCLAPCLFGGIRESESITSRAPHCVICCVHTYPDILPIFFHPSYFVCFVWKVFPFWSQVKRCSRE